MPTDQYDSDEYVGTYDKLVRDDIPAVVREDGNRPVTRRVDGDEYERYLAAKLREEATEYADALDENEPDAATLDELADVHAVLDAILDASDHSRDDVQGRVREKARDRGAFEDGIVLERIAASDDEDRTPGDDER